MQGYQFAHIETWSRKGVAKNNSKDEKVRRNGQRGWTAEQIIDEAAREPWASEHVGRGRRDPLVISGTCASFNELRDAHEEACQAKVSMPYTNRKTKKKGTRRRSVRVDTHTLYTAVISLPILSADAREDQTVMDECRKAFDLVIACEKRRINDAGGEFAMGAIHLDERHVHLHIYGLDRHRGSVNRLHPGKAALDEFRARHGALSSKGSDLFQRSKRAYCDAMREWQDDLHREALGRVGLCRFGPRRFRYSGGQWNERKREEEERAKAQTTLEAVGKITASQRAASDALDGREANIAEMQERLQADREKLAQERASVEENALRLDVGLATVEAMAAGYIEEDQSADESAIRVTQNAKKSDKKWQKLLARLSRTPSEASRIGALIGASLRSLQAEAKRQARESAMADARAEIERRFPGLGAVHRVAQGLVNRLSTPRERLEATNALDKAAKAEAKDVASFRRDASRPPRSDDGQEQ